MQLNKIKKTKMNRRGAVDPGQIALKFMLTIFGLTILGFLIIVVAGNLKTSTGFTVGSQEYNDTQMALNNITSGVAGFYSNVSTWFNILSVVIIIGLIILVWTMARSAGSGGRGGGGGGL